jgi:hypothetical protein
MAQDPPSVEVGMSCRPVGNISGFVEPRLAGSRRLRLSFFSDDGEQTTEDEEKSFCALFPDLRPLDRACSSVG